ncbi:MAG: glycosyltransferase family 39 protein [Acidobacteria bacterium]|nr:glycosyltransferase family 39 protein [Acidobacteriota bacterium]
MLELIPVWFGAAFCVAAALGVGVVCSRGLRLPATLVLAVGAAGLSLTIFFLMLAGVARPAGMAVLGGLAAMPLARWRPVLKSKAIPPAAAFVLVVFGVFYLIHALAPEIQTDANAYHLKAAADAKRSGGFSQQISFYERLPQGVQLLFAFAYAFGGSSAAKLVHFAFLIATVPLFLLVATRLGVTRERAAVAAALYAVTPVVGISGTAAFTDAALVFYTLATIALLLLWRENPEWRTLLFAGITAGFCYGIKLTGAVVIPPAALWIWRRAGARRAAIFAGGAALMIAPWLVRNAVEVGNPFAPLFNRLFPNPYFYIAIEQSLGHYLQSYGAAGPEAVIRALALTGDELQGLIGPIVLLAPLALLSLRSRSGRIALALAAFLAIPWFLNLGARFLMPALPFFALALVIALRRAGMYALLAAHAVLSFPAVVELYASRAWHLTAFPWRAALRIESERDYLERVSWDYRLARMVERHTEARARLLDLQGLHRALLEREVVGSWQSSLGARLTTGLEQGAKVDRGASYELRAPAPAEPVRALRLIQRADTAQSWSIQELELLRGHERLPARDWLIHAEPNLWDAALALDGNYISSWSTWEPARPGMIYEIEFAAPERLSEVCVIGPGGEEKSRPEISLRRADGTWTVLKSTGAPRPGMNLRRSATRLVRRAGIRYIVAPLGREGNGPLGELLVNRAPDWGLEVVANEDNVFLLRVQ